MLLLTAQRAPLCLFKSYSVGSTVISCPSMSSFNVTLPGTALPSTRGSRRRATHVSMKRARSIARTLCAVWFLSLGRMMVEALQALLVRSDGFIGSNKVMFPSKVVAAV
mmetsp:Transcript_54954/g.122907  ORF Transcript_54954/g.122907 Transcript_54954/m.122907 type:complete len:109 (+) Transcript_54954:495-821(+)